LLHYLDDFKLNFSSLDKNKDYNFMLKKFQQFENDFCSQQYYWYNEYVIGFHPAIIYRISYASNMYKLTRYTQRYFHHWLTNNLNLFDNLTDFCIVL